MNRYFETLEDFNTYTENGTRLTAGDLYFIKEVKMILKTNNFDGTMQTYEMSVSGGGDKEVFNIINYTATEKLVERSSVSGSGSGSGENNTFDEDGFQDENGQPLTITSHTFENGVGRIEFDYDIVQIGEDTFFNCTSLTSITIPDSVTSIGENAFYNCSGLDSMTIEATTPPTLVSTAIMDTNNCSIYVPAASVDAYKEAEDWSYYAERIQPIPTE